MSCNDITVEGSGHECDVKVGTWLKDLLPHLPGAVRKVVLREFINTCREFYEQSRSWRVVVGPKDLRAAKKRYTLSPYDAYANIVGIQSVEYLGTPLRIMERRPSGIEITADSPTRYYLEDPDTVRIWPTPAATVEDALTFYAMLTPKQTVTHLPRIAATHHYDALLDGALGRCMSHPAKPYSDLVRGQYHLKRFRNAIALYAGMAKQGYAGAQAWRFPRFAK